MASTLKDIITSIPIATPAAKTGLNTHTDTEVPHLWRYGCKVTSQNGEDGIIYYLLSKVGVTATPTVVEMCAGDGIECCSANLILNHGFTGYLLDGNLEEIAKGVQYYTPMIDQDASLADRLRFAHVWITKEVIVNVLDQMEVPKDLDMLVVDMDGNDYWILKSVMESKKYSPRVICVEYQDIIGPERALTIPYEPNFNCRLYDYTEGPNYAGASLQAFIKLLGEDYAFVGCEGLGFNGFFVRRDLLPTSGLVEMKDVTPCFDIDKVRNGMLTRWPRTSHMPWQEV